MRRSIILLLTFVLLGCTSVKSVDSAYTLDKSSENGLLIVSLTRKGGGMKASVKFTQADDSGPVQSVGFGKGMVVVPIPTPNLYSHIRGSGQIFAIELPAQTYAFTGWSVESGYATLRSNTASRIEFTIKPGIATYLGNFDFDVTDRFSRTVIGISVDWKDNFKVDEGVLEYRFPYLDMKEVEQGVAPGTSISEWGSVGDPRETIPAYP